MNKSLSISLGGFAFFIEEDAYEQLQKYIEAVKNSLLPDDDVNEIINDIETRIAELFKEYLGTSREVLTTLDVSKIIEVLGTPEQIESIDDEPLKDKKSKQKKLYRETDDKFISGVCGGISHYIGLDSLWVRVIVLILFISGVGSMPILIAYIVATVLVPEANTVSEKLEMRGEPINFDSIKNWSEIEKAGSKLGKKFIPLFEAIGTVFIKAFGLAFVIIGISIIAGSIAFSSFIMYLPFDLENEGWRYTLGIGLLYFIVLIPALSFLFSGLRILFNKMKLAVSPIFTTSILVLWIVSIIAFVNFTIFNHTIFRKEQVERKVRIELPQIKSDTIVVSANHHNNYILHKGDIPFLDFNVREQSIENGTFYLKIKNEMEIVPSKDEQFHMDIAYVTHVSRKEEASEELDKISYSYTIEGNKLVMDTFLTVPEEEGYSQQDVRVTLFVPEGKYVHNKNIDHFYYNHGNGWHDTWHQPNTTFLIQDNRFINTNKQDEKQGFKGAIEINEDDDVKSLNITVQ